MAAVAPDQPRRPDAATCLLHPYLWDAGKLLTFLQEASDRFEKISPDLLSLLENRRKEVVDKNWRLRLDPQFNKNLDRFRRYDGSSVQALLRVVRNAVRPPTHVSVFV